MVWVALAIGIFLFYKFVDPAHKKSTYKVLGGLTVVIAIFLSGYFAYQSWTEAQRKNGLSIKLDYKNLNQEKGETAKIINSVVMKNLNVVNNYYPDVDLPTIKNLIFLPYLDSIISPVYDLHISEYELFASSQWVESKSSKDLKKNLKFSRINGLKNGLMIFQI